MPIYKHIKVHVTDANGDALPEYNAQTHNRSSLMHCYIEGKDGMRFKIYIKAYKEHLFPPKPKQEKDGEWKPTPPEEIAKLALFPPPRRSPSPFGGRRRRSASLDELPFKAPWHFLATLHIDGREEADACKFLYLDEDQYDDEVMSYARVEEADGTVHRHYWSFEDVGIESVFTQLDLNLAHLEGDTKVKSSTGQIEVKIRRIALGPTRSVLVHGDHSMYPTDAEYSTKDAYIITRRKGRKIGGVERCPDWTLFDPKEEIYARFRFYYTDDRMLKRLGPLGKKTDKGSEGMASLESAVKRALKAESGDVTEMRKKVKDMDFDDDEEWSPLA